MSLLIFANGVVDEVEWIRPYLVEATAVWAANGGSRHLYRLNHLPDLLIGDMDSVEPAVETWLQKGNVPIQQHPAQKDETDLELALLLAAKEQFEQVLLFGLLGGRLDQTVANILLLANPALARLPIHLVTKTERAWLVRRHTEIVGKAGDIVSLIPLAGDVQVKQTTGLQWPLNGSRLVFGQARGVSNRLTADRASVTLSSGILLCVHTKDRS